MFVYETVSVLTQLFLTVLFSYLKYCDIPAQHLLSYILTHKAAWVNVLSQIIMTMSMTILLR